MNKKKNEMKVSAYLIGRPIRLGFVIDTGKPDSLLQILQTCTCLWGGSFNPILPICENLNRNIDFFEPDLLVIPEANFESIRFDENRKISLQSIHNYGLTINRVYDYLDPLKNRSKIAQIQVGNDNNPDVRLAATVMGILPKSGDFQSYYEMFFNPERIEINSNWLNLYNEKKFALLLIYVLLFFR